MACHVSKCGAVMRVAYKVYKNVLSRYRCVKNVFPTLTVKGFNSGTSKKTLS